MPLALQSRANLNSIRNALLNILTISWLYCACTSITVVPTMKNNIKKLYEWKRVTFTLSERISAKSLLSCHLYVALFSLSTIIVIEATHLQVGPINRYTHVMLLKLRKRKRQPTWHKEKDCGRWKGVGTNSADLHKTGRKEKIQWRLIVPAKMVAMQLSNTCSASCPRRRSLSLQAEPGYHRGLG